MDVGLFPPLGNGNANAEILRTLGREAEDRGFESIWVAEHVVMFDEYESQYPYADNGRFPGGSDTGLLEPLTALTYLAAVTDRIRLGTGICLVPQRNPVYTAKQVVDLDNLSGGRVDFGIGVGWLKEEFDVVAAPFDHRGARTDEYLQVMRTLWTDDVSSFDGEHYQLPECKLYPKPIQTPHPPIHVGGETNAALRRVARHGQGWYSFNRKPEDLDEPLARLDDLLAAEGRSRADITLTVCPYLQGIDAGAIEGYQEKGVDRLVVLCLAFDLDMLEGPARHPHHHRPRTSRALTVPGGETAWRALVTSAHRRHRDPPIPARRRRGDCSSPGATLSSTGSWARAVPIRGPRRSSKSTRWPNGGIVVGWVDHDHDELHTWLEPHECNVGYHVFAAIAAGGSPSAACDSSSSCWPVRGATRRPRSSSTPRTHSLDCVWPAGVGATERWRRSRRADGRSPTSSSAAPRSWTDDARRPSRRARLRAMTSLTLESSRRRHHRRHPRPSRQAQRHERGADHRAPRRPRRDRSRPRVPRGDPHRGRAAGSVPVSTSAATGSPRAVRTSVPCRPAWPPRSTSPRWCRSSAPSPSP